MRYSLNMINRNGYEIAKEFKSIPAAIQFSKFYPLSVFFGWIYDKNSDEMVRQNIYGDKWIVCTNESFIPYY